MSNLAFVDYDLRRKFVGTRTYEPKQAFINNAIINRNTINRYLWIEGRKFVSSEYEWLSNLRNVQLASFYNKLIRNSEKLYYRRYLEIKIWLYRNSLSFIVFNCKSPSYYYPSGLTQRGQINVVLMQIPPSVVFMVKKLATCDEDTNVWRQMFNKNETAFLTINPLLNSLRYSAKKKTIEEMLNKKLCHDFMRLLLHPGYFNRMYRRPNECDVILKINLNNSIRNNSTSNRTYINLTPEKFTKKTVLAIPSFQIDKTRIPFLTTLSSSNAALKSRA
jgi:hypothetical protein